MRPKLHNPVWQSALDQAGPSLDLFQASLNGLSEDIRALEKYLTDSGFRIDTRVSVNPGRSGEEDLGWVPIGRDTWRLVHILRDQEQDDQDGQAWELRPLIEAPVSARWRVGQAVPRLLFAIAKTASPSPSEPPSFEPLTDDDIPF